MNNFIPINLKIQVTWADYLKNITYKTNTKRKKISEYSDIC